MRYAAVLSSALLLLAFHTAHAQDDGATAAAQAAFAQAQQAAQQASQQAQQFAQQAAQQANQNLTDASNANAAAAGVYNGTRPPDFSLRNGTYPTAVTVRLHSPTHHASIFYTTDGWTPTSASTLYTGPITLSSTTSLQAIAVAPRVPAERRRRSRVPHRLCTSQTGPSQRSLAPNLA